jgi:hypothetical protein
MYAKINAVLRALTVPPAPAAAARVSAQKKGGKNVHSHQI